MAMFETAERPRYVEGYPRLDLLRLKAAADLGHAACEFTDQRRMLHGLAKVRDRTDDYIIIEYEITLPYLPGRHSSIKLDKVYSPDDVGMNRLMTHCPECSKPKIVLVYVERWACPHCHHLPYRSQTMDFHTRPFESRKKNSSCS